MLDFDEFPIQLVDINNLVNQSSIEKESKSKFEETLMGTPNLNEHPEFFTSYSWLFLKCSDKIFSRLFQPVHLFTDYPN